MLKDLKENIKVTIGQAVHTGSFDKWLNQKQRFRIANPAKQLDSFFKTVDTAKKDGSDFVLFPELFLPRDYLNKHVKTVCNENHFIIIGGLEYGPNNANKSDNNTPLANEAFIAIPPSLMKKENGNGIRQHSTIFKIPKILPAEEEENILKQNNYSFQRGNRLYVFESSVIGNWAVLICSDFMSLPIHVLLQSHIHTLFVLAYNKDVNGYASIADTVHRLLMCNVVICNMGNYGSSLAFSPYRKDHKRQKLRITGNEVDVAVTIELPLKNIDRAQRGEVLRDINSDQLFIKCPPDFGMFQIFKGEN